MTKPLKSRDTLMQQQIEAAMRWYRGPLIRTYRMAMTGCYCQECVLIRACAARAAAKGKRGKK